MNSRIRLNLVDNLSKFSLHATRIAAVKKIEDELLCFAFVYYLSFVSL